LLHVNIIDDCSLPPKSDSIDFATVIPYGLATDPFLTQLEYDISPFPSKIDRQNPSEHETDEPDGSAHVKLELGADEEYNCSANLF
jgi:hypothetical protein